jgi:aspartyl protease family protein
MRSVLTFAAAAIAAGLIVPRYAETMHPRHTGGAAALRPARPAQPASSDPATVEVARDSSGHFRLQARVDGRVLDFVVDTGASVIALDADDAAALGIHPGASDYTVLLKTANGTVRAAPATLGLIEVGDIAIRNVSAVVLPPGTLSDNLLGMTFLSRLRRFDYSGGKMVLEQ